MSKTAYSYLNSAIYQARDFLKRTGIYRQLRELEREQYLPLAELEALQNRRLQQLLTLAVGHSPYYKDLFKKSGIRISGNFDLSQLRNIPLLKREDLQNDFERILCDNGLGLMPNSSGGSSGNPVNFYQDQHYWNYSDACGLLFEEWMGVRPGDKTAIFWGADRDIKEISFHKKIWMKFDREELLNSFSMSEESIREFINKLNFFKPRYILGYASSLNLVAQVINSSKPLDFVPQSIRSSAETLYDFQRREIEKAFQAKIFDFYGSREVNNLASECEAHDGLHILSSGRIVEIVDENGAPVPDGAVGHVAVTDLTNNVFPFIRYLNGDMAVKSTHRCSCGRSYPLLEKIQGRTTDMIIVDGQYIHGEYFTHLFYERPEVKQFQVVQEDPETLRIAVVLRNKNAVLDDVMAHIRQKVGPKINIELQYVDSIPTTSTGKFRFTISMLNTNGVTPKLEA